MRISPIFIVCYLQYSINMSGDAVVTEIDHDEFNPRGTLALILVYFAILVVMWVFMYFVEFLGNDLTVIG